MKNIFAALISGELKVDEAIRILAVQAVPTKKSKRVKEHQIGWSEPGDPPTTDAPQSTNAVG